MQVAPPDSAFPALTTDGTGEVLAANAAADRAAGRPLAGTRLRDLLPRQRPHWTTFRHHVRGAGSSPLRVPILSVDQREVEVDVHVRAERRRELAARACQLI